MSMGLSCMVTSTQKMWRKRATARRYFAFSADILIVCVRYVLYGSTHNTSGAKGGGTGSEDFNDNPKRKSPASAAICPISR
jgi:hypothetical protein